MPPLSSAEVRAAMLRKLHDSLLTERHAKILKLQPMTESQAIEEGVHPPFAGFKIPYFTPAGKVIDEFFRYRFWPEAKASKGWSSIAEPSKLRYVQPKNSELHVYMPPLLKSGATWKDVMQHADADLFITEGELKAACVCANTTHIMLGLGGVFSWMSKRREQSLLPILEEFNWNGRNVYICFDSDQNTKPLVQLAASRLTLALTARGAIVHEMHLPPAIDGGKQGVDDFIAAQSVEAFNALLEDPNAVTKASASFELHRLNDEVALIWGGGPTGNVVRLEDGRLMTPVQFTRTLYRDRKYIEFTVNKKGEAAGPKTHYAADDWLEWPYRNRVRNITYAPGAPSITDDNEYNLWRPGNLVLKKGDIAPWKDLIARMFTGVEPLHIEWFKRWLAYPLRFPGTKLFSCALLWSHEGGTGKNLLAETMIPIYGADNYTLIKSKHLVSDFNSWAEGKQFIVGDEIALEDKRHTSGDLKSMLTSRVVRINRKGIESYEIPDCANYLFTSNEPTAMILDQGERRTFVVHVAEQPLGDAYGTAYSKWVAAGGAAAIGHYLVHELDIGDFSPTAKPPDTVAKLDLIANSRADVDTWAVALKLDPAGILSSHRDKFAGDARRAYDIYTPEDLLKIYDPEDRKRSSLRAVGIALDRAGFRKAIHNNGRLGNVRSTFWIIQNDDRSRAPMTSTVAAKMYIQERGLSFQEQRAADKEQRRKTQ